MTTCNDLEVVKLSSDRLALDLQRETFLAHAYIENHRSRSSSTSLKGECHERRYTIVPPDVHGFSINSISFQSSTDQTGFNCPVCDSIGDVRVSVSDVVVALAPVSRRCPPPTQQKYSTSATTKQSKWTALRQQLRKS